MTSSKQRVAARSPSAIADAWEQRTALVKQELAAASAYNDAKTARLKALRLEQEQKDGPKLEEAAAPKRAAKRVKRVVVGKG